MKRRQSGATLVEAAMTLMVFFVFIFAVFEFGRAFNIYTSMTDAAREAARYSVAPQPGAAGTLPTTGSGSGTVESMACSFLFAGGIVNSDTYPCSPATITVNQGLTGTVTFSSGNTMSVTYTQVQISAPYQFTFFPFGSITMTTEAVMRNETN